MENILIFPRKAPPIAVNSGSMPDAAGPDNPECGNQRRLAAEGANAADAGGQLRARLTGVIGLLEGALQEINPLLETLADEERRQELALRIAVACLEVERAKNNVSRLIGG